MKRLNTKIIVISVILIVVLAIFLVKWNQNYYDKSDFIEEFRSPDGEYTLSILFVPEDKNTAVPLASGTYMHSEAIVVLKNKEGKTLVKPTRLCHCKFSYLELNIEWLLDKKRVYFTKSDYIDLNKMTLVC